MRIKKSIFYLFVIAFSLICIYENNTVYGEPILMGIKMQTQFKRFLDPKGVIVGLSPKGHKAKKDTSGFVIRNYANHNA